MITTSPTPDNLEQLQVHSGDTKDAIILIREALSLMRAHGQTELSVDFVSPKLRMTITAKR
jgi:hypothetical protein